MSKKYSKLKKNITNLTKTVDYNVKQVIDKVDDPKLWESTTILFFIPLIILIIIMIGYLIYREIHKNKEEEKK
tara:strand:+ start:218 stop:436 length:219 start_codon:yes stop_codon:yes gene_type:complete